MAENPKEEEKTSEVKDQAEGTEPAAPEHEPPHEEAKAAEGVEEGAEENAEEEESEEDKLATQEAIARRVAALGEEDAIERIARAEEEKLAERRRLEREAKRGKGKKKTGLEAAASKRLAKIGTKAPPPKRAVATAVDGADPLIEKTAEFSKWVKKNQKSVGILAAAAVIAVGGFGVYTYLQGKREGDASVALATAVADERGRIGDPAKEDDDPDRPKDPRPIFKTAVDRREAALTKYREVEGKYAGTGAAFLARLGEGSLLLDKQDPDGAISAFNDAQNSPLAKVDVEVRGRALEGLGFAYELKAAAASGDDKTKWQDEALKRFHDLENTDVQGFKELGIYHQARVAESKGDKDKAKELLKTLHDRLSKPEGRVFPALQQLTEDRLRALDPSAVPPKTPVGGFGGLGGGGGNKMTEAQIRAIQEAMRKAQQQQGGAPPGGSPP